MTAGPGITHSERFEKARREGGRMHGIQAWVALPTEKRRRRPPLPITPPPGCPLSMSGAEGRLIAGSKPTAEAPRSTRTRPCSTCTGTWKRGRPRNARRNIPSERSYVAGGAVEIEGRRFVQGQMVVFDRGNRGSHSRRRTRDADVSRRRAARTSLHRVELRILIQGADRTGQGRLAGGADEAARPRPCRIHSAARLMQIPVDHSAVEHCLQHFGAANHGRRHFE